MYTVFWFSILNHLKICKWRPHCFSQCKLFSKVSLWHNLKSNWKTNDMQRVENVIFYKIVFLSYFCISNGKLVNSCKLQIGLNPSSFLFPPFLYVHFLDTLIKPYKFYRLVLFTSNSLKVLQWSKPNLLFSRLVYFSQNN